MRAPEWQGWVALAALAGAFLAAGWWLFFSPLPGMPGAASSRTSPRARQWVSVLVLASGVLFITGARWDELWHRKFGGFADDFLWPPHLLLYAGLGLNAIFAVAGLAVAGGVVRRSATEDGLSNGTRWMGIRRKVRAEPMIGFLGLTAMSQMASIPSDLLWHEIIGPDLTAWSLPHLLLALTTAAVLWAGIGLSRASARTWRGRADILTVCLIAASQVSMMQIGTTEWDWAVDAGSRAVVDARPIWAWPVVCVVVGSVHAVAARTVTGRIGTATAVAGIGVVVQGITVMIGRAVVPPGPGLASAMSVMFGALAADAWWWLHRRPSDQTVPAWLMPVLSTSDLWTGYVAWFVGFTFLGLPYLAVRTPQSSDPIWWILALVVGLPAGAVASGVTRDAARWIAWQGAGLGRTLPPAPRPVPALQGVPSSGVSSSKAPVRKRFPSRRGA
ncbi:MAG: hypothetical protein EXR45_08415 [Chloroflexi bacterium]|nr:hypothetical protein [Chloroflexota bacterium]